MEGTVQHAEPEDMLLCRFFVPKRNLRKAVRLNPEDTVWAVKLQLIYKLSMESEADEALNYGIYYPKAGIFLDEQRVLGSYFFTDNVYFEFKTKCRIQQLPEKVVAKVNTRKNQRQLLEYVQSRQTKRVREMCEKGLDPHFFGENGETPLTLAALNDDVDMIHTLDEDGGALLDFRAQDGKTALHKAAAKGKIGALSALLRRGASPNYRDGQNLTPLYDAAANGQARCVQMLLEANSCIGTADSQLRTELHQACAHGYADVAELLIDYGADMNALNELGNTPLHMCATKGQLECGKVLLRKGCSRTILNSAGNTAFQTAIMFNNHELAEAINSFKDEDIVPPKRKFIPTVVAMDPLAAAADLELEDFTAEEEVIPPPPPPGFVGIFISPLVANRRRVVYSTDPAPPLPGATTAELGGGSQAPPPPPAATAQPGHEVPPPPPSANAMDDLPPPPPPSISLPPPPLPSDLPPPPPPMGELPPMPMDLPPLPMDLPPPPPPAL